MYNMILCDESLNEDDVISRFSFVPEYINIYILITIKVSKMTKVTLQAFYKKNIEIKKKKKKINESSDDF